MEQLSFRRKCSSASEVIWVQFDSRCVILSLFTILSKSPTVRSCRTVKLDTPTFISYLTHTHSTLSMQCFHSQTLFPPPLLPFLPRHLISVKSPSVSPPLSLSTQLHPFLCSPLAVSAPSHVCQSQLAHLLLHANTPQRAHTFITYTPASQM